MKLKREIVSCALLALAVNAHAGFYNFTMHSCANCSGFNESISWHWNHNNYLITYGQHRNSNAAYSCDFHTGWALTWRSAAYHFAEGYGGWYVTGQHWGVDQWGNPIKLANTDAIDCKIYDGWWDK